MSKYIAKYIYKVNVLCHRNHCATEIPLIDSNPRFTWTTSSLSNLLLASVLRLQMGLGRKIASCELKWLLQYIAGSQTEYPRPLWHFQKVPPSLMIRELEFWVQLRLSLPGSLQFEIGPNWSQFIAGLASGLIFSCVFLDSLFQLGLFHKSLIFLLWSFMLIIQSISAQVTTTMAGVALQ